MRLMNISKTLKTLSHSYGYWWAIIIASLFLLGFALYFQHIKEELPCVACIQIRLLLSLLILISITGLLTCNIRLLNKFAHFFVFLTAIGLSERSYLLLGTERGFIFADCGFTLGLPAWFAIESWFPWLYRIETSCGYTPEIAFGMTMAEALMVMSVLFLIISFSITAASLLNIKKSDQS